MDKYLKVFLHMENLGQTLKMSRRCHRLQVRPCRSGIAKNQRDKRRRLPRAPTAFSLAMLRSNHSEHGRRCASQKRVVGSTGWVMIRLPRESHECIVQVGIRGTELQISMSRGARIDTSPLRQQATQFFVAGIG